jgi:hypothetical protein
MCKIYGLTNTEKLAPAALSALIERAHKQLTLTQRDGWGYALGDYVERWDSPSDWAGHGKWAGIQAALGGLDIAVDCEVSEGKPPAPGPALICHARTATCARGAKNAHPHAWDGWRIVHNGVVESTGGKAKRSCDSMHICDSLAKHKGASGLAADLAGYLAILGTNPAGEFIALRDDRAPLFVAWCHDLQAWAFASTPELLAAITALPITRPYALTPFVAHTLKAGEWVKEHVAPWASAAESRASVAFGDYYRPSEARGRAYMAAKMDAGKQPKQPKQPKPKQPKIKTYAALKAEHDARIAEAWPMDPAEDESLLLTEYEKWDRAHK